MSKRFLTPLGLHSSASDPSSASIGNIYFNTASNVLRVYFNSQWNSLHNVTASYGLSTDYIDFSLNPLSSASVGRLQWSDGEGTLTVGLKGGNINLDIGQEQVSYCYNGTGSALSIGQVVYITGAQGQRPSIALSSASIETTSTKTFAVVAESIPNGSEGFVTTFGIVKNIDTSSFSSGAPLWLSVTPGQMTASVPATPYHSVFIGYAIKSHPSSGEVFVNIQNGYEIEELHNVLITSPTASQVLMYNSSSSIWTNQSINSVASATVSASSNISSLTSQTDFTTLTLSGSTVATEAWVEAQGYSTGGGGNSSSIQYSTASVRNTSTTVFINPTGMTGINLTAGIMYKYEISILYQVISSNQVFKCRLNHPEFTVGTAHVIIGTNTTQVSYLGLEKTLTGTQTVLSSTTSTNAGATLLAQRVNGFILPSADGILSYDFAPTTSATGADVFENSYMMVTPVMVV